MLTITCDAHEPVLYIFDLFMHDLPNSPPLRASVGDSALGGFVFAAQKARWGFVWDLYRVASHALASFWWEGLLTGRGTASALALHSGGDGPAQRRFVGP
jgi:hypothetical protein